MMNKLKTNLAAAKLLQRLNPQVVGDFVEYDVPQNSDSPTQNDSGYHVLGYVFDIFEDPSDLVSTLKMLMIKHGVCITPEFNQIGGDNVPTGRYEVDYKDVLDEYDTLEEAVAAAVFIVANEL